MRHVLWAAIAALLSAVLSSAAPASTVIWTLNNVGFSDGGIATGWLSVDNVSHNFLSWDFFVSGGNTAIFPPIEYNPSTSLFLDDDTGNPPVDKFYTLPLRDGFRFLVHTPDTSMPDTRRDFRLPINDLPDAGGVVALNINPEGVECFNCGPERTFISGEIVASFETPLPAALPLFATGLGALGLLGWRKKRKQTSRAISAAALFIAAIVPANAAVFHIERLSDTQGILTATGLIIGNAPRDNPPTVLLYNPYGIQPGTFDNEPILQSSTFKIGAVNIDFAYTCGTAYNYSCIGSANGGFAGLYFGSEIDAFNGFNAGDGFSGTLLLQLVGGATFAPVGTTGDAYWGLGLIGAVGPNGDFKIGTWEIESATPVPAALPLFVAGLGTITLLGWRRKRKARAKPQCG